MPEEAQRPEDQDERPDNAADDETEVVPHSDDAEEELPWCVGFFD